MEKHQEEIQNKEIKNEGMQEREIQNEKARQTNYRIGTIVSVLVILFATIASWGIASMLLRLAFVVCYMAAIMSFFIYYKQDDDKKKKFPVIFGIAAGCILVLASAAEGKTAGDYIARVGSFFYTDKKEKELYSEREQQEIQQLIDNTRELEEIVNAYAAEGENLQQLGEHIRELSESMDEKGVWQDEKDPEEVEEILQKIREKTAEYEGKGYFDNLQTDGEQAEFFYKTQLSEELYYYKNVVAALEEYGLDCEKFGIDEYTLVCWDADVFMIFYNMSKSLEQEPDVVYKDWPSYYAQYKSDLSKYKDTFDYEDWKLNCDDKSVNGIMGSLDYKIMMYYAKFIMNFEK